MEAVPEKTQGGAIDVFCRRFYVFSAGLFGEEACGVFIEEICGCKADKDLLKYASCVSIDSLKGGAELWQSVISVARASISELKSATLIEDQTKCGNRTSKMSG